MTDDLEELAKKGRATDQTAKDEEKHAAGVDADFRRYLTERLVAKTFYQVHAHRWIVPAFFVLIAGVGTYVTLTDSEHLTTVFIALIPIGFVGGFFLLRMAESAAIRAGTKWVSGLPFTFQSGKYLEALSRERTASTLTLRIRFERAPSKEDKQMFADACAGAVAVSERKWDDDTLRISTPRFDTYFPARNDKESYFSNAQLHLWFRTLVDVALKPIHGRSPIARIKVRVDG